MLLCAENGGGRKSENEERSSKCRGPGKQRRVTKTAPAWVSSPGASLAQGLLDINIERSVPRPCGESQTREAAVQRQRASASPGLQLA